jgi:hypothetical protein
MQLRCAKLLADDHERRKRLRDLGKRLRVVEIDTAVFRKERSPAAVQRNGDARLLSSCRTLRG